MNFLKHLEKAYVTIPLLLIVAGFVFFNAATSQEKEKEAAHETPKTEEVAEDKEATAFNGEGIYNQSCIGCHGDAYQGAVGPKLTGLSDNYKVEDVEKILKEGKGDGMPGELVKGQEKQMAEWLLTLK